MRFLILFPASDDGASGTFARAGKKSLGCLPSSVSDLVVQVLIDWESNVSNEFVGQFQCLEVLKIQNCGFSCSVLRDFVSACSRTLVKLELASLRCKGTMEYQICPKLKKLVVSNALREVGSRLINMAPNLVDLRLFYSFERSEIEKEKHPFLFTSLCLQRRDFASADSA